MLRTNTAMIDAELKQLLETKKTRANSRRKDTIMNMKNAVVVDGKGETVHLFAMSTHQNSNFQTLHPAHNGMKRTFLGTNQLRKEVLGTLILHETRVAKGGMTSGILKVFGAQKEIVEENARIES